MLCSVTQSPWCRTAGARPVVLHERRGAAGGGPVLAGPVVVREDDPAVPTMGVGGALFRPGRSRRSFSDKTPAGLFGVRLSPTRPLPYVRLGSPVLSKV